MTIYRDYIQVYIDRENHRKLKVRASKKSKTITQELNEILEDLFNKEGE